MGVAKKILFGFAALLLLSFPIATRGGAKVGCGHPAVIAQIESGLRALPFTAEMFGTGFNAREITTVNERGSRSLCQCSIGSTSQTAFTLPVRYTVTRADDEKTFRVEITQIGR
ncbi:hypothetical protein [Methylocystis sp. ATCC 49242]|uniref:hypothetical protein n=1 Tax=Methylocystis sp. ATCC 49242 TaxID=622637 RepID=UPI0001F86D41|nr:hypothetical protein [Methylocystis sp. ATCC 49242]